MPAALLRVSALACALLASLLGLAGCGASFELTVPESFVRLEDDAQEVDGYDLRAVSNEGVVIGMQTIDHRVEGTLAFWSDAVLRRLRDRAGYALLSADDIHAASGEAGRILRLGRDLNGRPYRYTLAVFVTPSTIYIAEAGGPEEAFVALEPQVEAALVGTRLDP